MRRSILKTLIIVILLTAFLPIGCYEEDEDDDVVPIPFGCYDYEFVLNNCQGSDQCRILILVIIAYEGLLELDIDGNLVSGYIQVQSELPSSECYRFPVQGNYDNGNVNIEGTLALEDPVITLRISAEIVLSDSGEFQGTATVNLNGIYLGEAIECTCNGIVDGDLVSKAPCDFDC